MGDEFRKIKGPGIVSQLFSHIWHMRGWQKTLFAAALGLLGAGAAGQLVGAVSSPARVPDSGSSIVATSPVPEEKPTLRQRMAPIATKLGAGFLGGFFIGWALRTFLRITTLALTIGLGIFMALSYFNIDVTSWKSKFESGVHHVEDKATQLKEKAERHLPSSGGGLLGAFTGFKRKKIMKDGPV